MYSRASAWSVSLEDVLNNLNERRLLESVC